MLVYFLLSIFYVCRIPQFAFLCSCTSLIWCFYICSSYLFHFPDYLPWSTCLFLSSFFFSSSFSSASCYCCCSLFFFFFNLESSYIWNVIFCMRSSANTAGFFSFTFSGVSSSHRIWLYVLFLVQCYSTRTVQKVLGLNLLSEYHCYHALVLAPWPFTKAPLVGIFLNSPYLSPSNILNLFTFIESVTFNFFFITLWGTRKSHKVQDQVSMRLLEQWNVVFGKKKFKNVFVVTYVQGILKKNN